MEESAKIARALELGQELRELEERRKTQLMKVKRELTLLDIIEVKTRNCWLEVGRLRSTGGSDEFQVSH